MNETRSSKRNTREVLLDVAQDLIQKRGLNAVSFQDLSDAVGIRKASVHHHFGNKAEMVRALVDRFLAEFYSNAKAISQSHVKGKTKFKRFCQLFLNTLCQGEQNRNCLCGMLMAEIASVEPAVKRQLQHFVQVNLELLEQMIHDGIEDGSLKAQDDVRGTALVIISALEGGLLVARCDQGVDQFERLTKRLTQWLSE